MDIEKPLPMQIGGTYFYTLTSYDPVDIEVTVMSVTDEDVEQGYRTVIKEQGGDPATASDEWVAEHFEGRTPDELRTLLRRWLEHESEETAERDKLPLCVGELKKRLGQTVPREVVDSYEQGLRQQAEAELSDAGLSLDDLNAQLGQDASALFHSQAVDVAERSAALDAYASEKKLNVADDEIPVLLGLSPEDYQRLVDEGGAGAKEGLRESALREKAGRSLVAECSCTYHHETPEEAAKRIEAYRRIEQAARVRDSFENDDADSAQTSGVSGDNGGFRLV